MEDQKPKRGRKPKAKATEEVKEVKVTNKVEPKKILADKLDSVSKEVESIKMNHRQEINTSTHALLNKALSDFRRIARTLRK